MPRSKTGKKRDPIDPESMKRAIEAVTASPEKKISIREACKIYNVKFATLVRQLDSLKKSGIPSCDYKYTVTYNTKQVFTEEEEKCLVSYIEKIAKMQYGLTKKGVRKLAYKFAVANNKNIPNNWHGEKVAGVEWLRHFLKRYSSNLSLRVPEKTSLSRSTSFNKFNVNKFFDNMEDAHKRLGPFPPERIWNLDETGLTTVQNPKKIISPKGVKQIGKATSAERGQLVTLIACINAIGNHIPPMLIFPRVHFKEFMLRGAPAGTIGGANQSGWSNEALFLKFLEHFIQHVKPTKEDKVLLLFDNHETHLSLEAVERASEAGVVMLTFPPHTSHKLQPLDISIYSPLKGYYNGAVDNWLLNNPGKTMDIYCIAEVLGEIYSRAFSTSNIISGFKKPGIFPINRNAFSDDDFLASYVTDRVVEIPENNNQTVDNVGFISQPSTSGLTLTTLLQVEPRPTAQFGHEPVLNFSNDIQGPKVTLEELQPYPKAGERKKGAGKGRKPGRTKIVTDTPEKEEIRKLKMMKVEQENNKILKLEGKKKKTSNPEAKTSKVKITKKIVFSSEDDTEDEEGVGLPPYKESSDEDELRNIINEEIIDAQELFDFERNSFEVGEFVLVSFSKKKGPNEHYVGKVVSKEDGGFEFKMLFYSRIGQSNKFVVKSYETFDVNEEDILVKLPKPNQSSGSSRVSEQLIFPVDFSSLNVK